MIYINEFNNAWESLLWLLQPLCGGIHVFSMGGIDIGQDKSEMTGRNKSGPPKYTLSYKMVTCLVPPGGGYFENEKPRICKVFEQLGRLMPTPWSMGRRSQLKTKIGRNSWSMIIIIIMSMIIIMIMLHIMIRIMINIMIMIYNYGYDYDYDL